jgi:RNA polymerase sigma-70 factor (ECF subfamily)
MRDVKKEQEILSHESFIRRVAKCKLGYNYHDWVDDVVQDILYKIIKHPEKYNPSMGSFESWLSIVTRNYCYDLMKKKDNKFANKVQLEEVSSGLENDPPFKEDHQLKNALNHALAKLDRRDQKILELKYFFHSSGKQIAEKLSIPSDQVSVYLMRAKKRLKKLLESNVSLFEFRMIYME